MAVIFLRTLIIYLTLVIIMRLMGKRQIGEMQPFEFIVTLIIADLACVPMSDVSIPLLYGVVGIVGLFLLHQIFSLIEQSGDVAKKIISGKPSIVINKDGVDLAELKKNNLSVEDLIESMRASGYFSLDDLSYAIYEANGKLSAFPSGKQTSASLPLLLVSDGKTIRRNLSVLNINESDVADYIEQNGGSLTSTEVLTVDGNGRVYFKKKKSHYEIFTMKLAENVTW